MMMDDVVKTGLTKGILKTRKDIQNYWPKYQYIHLQLNYTVIAKYVTFTLNP